MDSRGKKIAAGIGTLAGVAALVLAVRGGTPQAQPSMATLSGTVLDSVTGAGIPGVKVDMDGHSATTDSSGKFQISNVPPDIYDITLTKEGYL